MLLFLMSLGLGDKVFQERGEIPSLNGFLFLFCLGLNGATSVRSRAAGLGTCLVWRGKYFRNGVLFSSLNIFVFNPGLGWVQIVQERVAGPCLNSFLFFIFGLGGVQNSQGRLTVPSLRSYFFVFDWAGIVSVQFELC